MLPIKLNIPKKFFKEELRDGYLVTEDVKKLWAIQLDLLNELIDVCKRNDLKVFVDSGTLLGTIRHKGFIPWDNDVDVIMLRPDYEKLCKIAKKEFKKPYFLQTMYNDKGYAHLHAKLRNSATTGIMKVEAESGISYNQGIYIDVFVLDYVPNEGEDRASKKERIDYMNAVEIERRKLYHLMRATVNYRVRRDKYMVQTDFLRSIADTSNKTYEEICQEQAIVCDKVIKETGIKPTDRLYTHEFFSWRERHFFDPKWFRKVKYAKFEMLKVPIPVDYLNVLETWYGKEWQTPIIGAHALHGNMIVDTEKSYKAYIKEQNKNG